MTNACRMAQMCHSARSAGALVRFNTHELPLSEKPNRIAGMAICRSVTTIAYANDFVC